QKQKNKTTPNPSKSFLERFGWIGVLAIVGLTFFVFAEVVDNDFIDYQDNEYILENSLLRDISFDLLETPVANKYQPLTILSLAFNYESANLAPKTYHWTNLLLHLVNVVLVFYFLYLLSSRKLLVGLIGALLFAVHPMQVEAVAWLSVRSVLLCGFFVLISFILYLKHLETQKPWWKVGAIFTYIFALFSSPAAIVFPFALLAIHYFRRNVFDRKLVLKWIPFWAISLGFLVMALYYRQVGNIEGNVLDILMDSCYAFTLYFLKFIIPFKLAAFHPSPSLVSTQMFWYYISPIVVLGFAGLTVWAARSGRRLLAFGLLFFAANIVWFLPFLQSSESVISESHVYIAYIGLAFVVAHTIHNYLQHSEKSQQFIGKVLLGGGLLATFILAFISHERVAVWESNFTVWEDSIDKYPQASYMGYAFKGDYYASQGNYTEALNQYNRSVEIYADYGTVYHRRALTNHFLKKTKDAEADYLRAIEFGGEGKYVSYANLCKIHRMEGDYEQAMKECSAAIEGGDFEQKYNVYLQRGTMLALANNFKGALADYNVYLQHDTQDGKVYRWRGIAYYELGKLNEAMKDVQSALNLDPSDAIAYMYRYRIYKKLGNNKEARLDSIRAKEMGAPM
ncbi:MAG: tetratricopeptide repeat protein, partial [Chitinophagales bacterium]